MTTALAISGLRKTYDNGFEALKGIDLKVEQGDFFALLGPNGAGKSTTISVICSLLKKSAGDVFVFEHDIDTDRALAKQQIGLVPQEFNFSSFDKVIDILCFQAGYYGMKPALAKERAEKYLKRLGLWEKRNDQARWLSGGMKRRLMIARALVHEPRLLILDEPTAGVDIELRRSMWNFLTEINKAGTTIILTTHYLEEAESLCRNIAIIDAGRIVANTSMRELLSQLQWEMFILDCKSALPDTLPALSFEAKRKDERTLEIALDKSGSLNSVFAELAENGIEVSSMRNKSNRLEELFISLLAEGES